MSKRTAVIIPLSLALGLAGLYLAVGEAVFRPETYRVQNPGVPVAVFIVITFLAKWASPAVRIWLLCRAQKIPIPYRSALLVHLVAIFGAALAPQNTGFGPATVAALSRLGVPIGRGIGVAMQVVVLDLVFFAWTVPLSLTYLVYSDVIELPSGITVVALTTACLGIVAAAVLSRRPRFVAYLIFVVARWRFMARFASRLRRIARDYYRSARTFLKMPAPYWSALHLATAVGWFGGFALLWVLMRLYGVEVDLLATLAVLTGLTLVSNFVPTPGAAGFMEAAVGFSIGANSGGGAGAALLVWRLASFYAIFLLGPLAGWLLILSRSVAATGGGRETRHRTDPRPGDHSLF
ncbi:MAG: flippase-like domain-containing protein [Actinomycetota bacterium]|nr:flippase-like domain-containing protein [Actinomycetota bacterium]